MAGNGKIFRERGGEMDPTATSGGLDALDEIWNRALGYASDDAFPEGVPDGIRQLSFLLRVYTSAMGGGLTFAFEVNEDSRMRRAVDAMRYFQMDELASFWEDLIIRQSEGDSLDDELDQFVDLVEGDSGIEAAFRNRAAEDPQSFGLNSGS
jgi:hypothetical protein